MSHEWQKLNAKAVVLHSTTNRHQVLPIARLIRPADQNCVYSRRSSPDHFLSEQECKASHTASLNQNGLTSFGLNPASIGILASGPKG